MYISKQEFYDKIGDPIREIDRYKSALATALDIRKFEIDLYWRRSQYFWAFTSIAFGAYGYVWNLARSDSKFIWLPFILSVILILISINWYLVVRGSKFWQDNWERHVDLLEDVVHGPIYKTIIISKPRNHGLFNAYPFSVSKLNQSMCAFFYFISLGLFVRESAIMIITFLLDLKDASNIINEYKVVVDILTIVYIFILVLVFLIVLKKACFSDFGMNYDIVRKGMKKGTSKIFERETKIL